MKEKKNNRAKKVLLMAISCALVAAISVGVTLAYLTAKTNEKNNKFIAAGGITGRVFESDYDFEKAVNFVPGEKITKNPKVDNNTDDADVWVGASVEFIINTGNGDVTVPYSTFSKYVDIENYVGVAANAEQWEKLTPSKNESLDYFFYNKLLTNDQGDNETPTRLEPQKDDNTATDTYFEDGAEYLGAKAQADSWTNTSNAPVMLTDAQLKAVSGIDDTNLADARTAAATQYNRDKTYYKQLKNGISGTKFTDETKALFTAVTPKTAININGDYDTSDPEYYDNSGTLTAKTYVATNTAVTADNLASYDLAKTVFAKFDFKIKVTGYGVRHDSQTIETETSSGNTIVKNENTNKTDLTDKILIGLGGKSAT